MVRVLLSAKSLKRAPRVASGGDWVWGISGRGIEGYEWFEL
jgi:hypothetical protein